MAYSKATKEGSKPLLNKNIELNKSVIYHPILNSNNKSGNMQLIDSNVYEFSEEDLQPIEGLNIDAFAKQAADYFSNPNQFAGFVKGWINRGKITKSTETIELLEKMLISMRNACRNASELQTEILKSRILFKVQAQIALQQASLDGMNIKSELLSKRIEIAKKELQLNIIEDIKQKGINDLSEIEKLFLVMLDFSKEADNSISNLTFKSATRTENGDSQIKFNEIIAQIINSYSSQK